MLFEPGALPDDYATAFAEGSITLWANLPTLIATHLREQGVPRAEVSAANHLMAVYTALETS
jgi:hypothetical protein